MPWTRTTQTSQIRSTMCKQSIKSFNTTDYPVILADKNGKIKSKNIAAGKFLKGIRVGMLLKSNSKVLENGNLSLDSTLSPYKNALKVDVDENHSLYFFSLFLQRDDIDFSSNEIEPLTLNELSFNSADFPKQKPGRLYTEIISAFSAFNKDFYESDKMSDLGKAISSIKERFIEGFRVFGNKALIEATKEFTDQRFFLVNFNAFVYTVMRTAYIAMKLSQNGSAELICDYDENARRIYVSAKSKTGIDCESKNKNAHDFLSELIPELKTELEIEKHFEKESHVTQCSVQNGIFSMTSSLSADPPSTLVLKSFSEDRSEQLIEALFKDFFDDLHKSIK